MTQPMLTPNSLGGMAARDASPSVARCGQAAPHRCALLLRSRTCPPFHMLAFAAMRLTRGPLFGRSDE
jgi:hypothetical protein